MNTDGVGRWLAIAASVLVLATVVAAVTVIGGPAQQRLVRFDERRIEDLVRIEALVATHVERTGELPVGLATLAAQPGLDLALADPEGRPYGYEPRDALRYRLCADFATDTAQPRSRRYGDDWSHGAGRQCFERRAAGRDAPATAEVPG